MVLPIYVKICSIPEPRAAAVDAAVTESTYPSFHNRRPLLWRMILSQLNCPNAWRN